MADKTEQRAAERYSPDKQLAIFSKTRFFGFLMIAIVGHAIFLAVTSVSYIRDKYIDPEGAELRKKQEKEAIVAAQKSTVMMEAGRIGSSNVAAMVTAQTSAAVCAEIFAMGKNAAATPATNANSFLKQIVNEMPTGRPTDSKIIKQITDLPKSNEIPANPSQEIRLRIEDTN